MGREKSLYKYMVETCDFHFNFMEVNEEWSLPALIRAIDIGSHIRTVCILTGLDWDIVEKEVKLHALRQLYEEASHLKMREIELMTQYADHTVLGYKLGDLLNELMFMDPQAWLESFENSILYLNDEEILTGFSSTYSELSNTQKEEAIQRMFGEKIPLEFNSESFSEHSKDTGYAWNEIGRRYGSGYRFFRRFVRQDWFLHPHPNDLAKDNRRSRLRAQHLYFQNILKDISNLQDIKHDRELYENEMNTYYLEYATARILEASEDSDPKDKRKWDTLIKFTALFTIVKSLPLRLVLLDNLLQDPQNGKMPFNLGGYCEADIEYLDEDDFLDNENDIQEGRAGLYMIILFIAEFNLKLFLRKKLNEACLYFGYKAIDTLQEIEDSDKIELTTLKQRLIPLVLLRNINNELHQRLLNQEPFSVDQEPISENSDKVFNTLYKWVYEFEKATQSHLFHMPNRHFYIYGRHRVIRPASDLTYRMKDFDQTFKRFAKIKTEDLGFINIDKVIDKL